MNIFRNKILVKIIAIICVFLTLINFGASNKVYAKDDNEVWGGILITPITKLLTSLADGIIGLLQKAIQKQDISIITISGTPNWWEKWGETALKVLLITVAVVVVGIVVAGTVGTAATIITGIAKVLKAALPVIGIDFIVWKATGQGGATHVLNMIVEKFGNWFGNNLYMPVFTLTPGQIFSDKIWLFDVNFFEDPSEKNYEITKQEVSKKEGFFKPTLNHSYTVDYTTYWSYNHDELLFLEFDDYDIGNELIGYSPKNLRSTVSSASQNAGTIIDILYKSFNIVDAIETKINENDETTNTYTLDMKVLRINKNQKMVSAELALKQEGETKYTIWLYSAPSPALEKEYDTSLRVYKGKHIDGGLNEIISQEMIIYGTSTETQITQVQTDSIAVKLSRAVASWYFILRNLALLALMVILIYTGIRIVIASTAGKKAKYKERLTDWLVAMCLVFILHYIMIFSIEIVERITKLIDSIDGNNQTVVVVPLTDQQTKYIENMGEDNETVKDSLAYTALQNQGAIIDGTDEKGNSQKELVWITDLMGKVKVQSQIEKEGTAKWVGYSLCYLILVLFTLFFSFTYLKRVVYMAFLTIIAPLVAMTYPIDKINDGQAQAFNMWLKEYIFNLLIQPMHLLLYTVLVTAAYELAATNALYAVVAIGFMIPAEKLVRKFFGFTKAQTPGALGGAAGAALAFSGLQRLMKFGNKKSGSKNNSDQEKEDAKINFASKEGVNAREAVAKNAIGDKAKDKKQHKTEEVGSADDKPNNAIPKTLPVPKSTGAQAKGEGSANPSDMPDDSSKEKKNWLKNNADKFKNTKFGKGTIKGFKTIGSGIGAYGRSLGKKMTRRINKARPIRALARGIAGVYGATALGMAGLALGAASGDPTKAFQYGTAGLAGGYGLGKGLGGKAVDALSVNSDSVKNAMEMTWAGDEYKHLKVQQQKDALVRDEDAINYLRKTRGVTRGEAQEILKTTGGICIDNNINDKADIAAISQMVEEGVNINAAIAAQKFSGYLPKDLDKMGKEEREDKIARWAQEYEEDGYDDPTYLANEHMKLVEQFIKTKSALKKA